MKRLLEGKLRLEQLGEKDVVYDITQKGVDAMMSLDIASLAYKRLVERIVLITGDADFVPAANWPDGRASMSFSIRCGGPSPPVSMST